MDTPDLIINASSVNVDEEKRTISGLVVPFGIVGSTSAGKTVVGPGAIKWSADTRRVKLLREHQTADSVGFASHLAEHPDGIHATFKVPTGDNGDRALAEAANGVRDGLSVGLYSTDGRKDSSGNYQVSTGTLREVSLVSLPAFDDARVTNVSAQLSQEKDMENENTIAATEPADTKAVLAALTENTNAVKALIESKSVENGTQVTANLAGPNGETLTAKDLTLDDVVSNIRAAGASGGNVAANFTQNIQAALSDVIPSNALSLAWKPAYQSELLGQVPYTRTFINNAVTVQPFANARTIVRPKWTTKPAVATYAGAKAAVPSGTVAMTDVTFTVEQWAAGHDVDRSFFDLADPAYITAFLAARMESYQRVTNTNAVTKAVAGATVLDSDSVTSGVQAYDNLLDGIKAGAKSLVSAGYSPQYVAVSVDLMDALWSITADTAPAWFGGSVNLANGNGDVSGIQIFVEADLADSTFIVGNKAGLVFQEKSPVEIQAVNIANGGIDLGIYGYTFTYVADANALAVGTVS